MRNLRAVLTAPIIALGLTACALSPQVIEVKPTPKVDSQNIGNNTPVAVSATDQRSDSAFGTRGGIYGDTSLIRPADDIPQVLISAVKKGLQAQGFNAYNPTDNASGLDIRLKELSYVPESGSIVNRVEVKAVIEAAAINAAGDKYVGTYSTGNTYEQPVTPSAKRNEEMINEVLSRGLTKMFADPNLTRFLTGNGAGNSTSNVGDDEDINATVVIPPINQ
ncbi:MAG: YajG family lipoprotein [Alcanivoracaceae bacterium]|nr:YajG family lipoprotein [Alcanivoracaceae bacterium]